MLRSKPIRQLASPPIKAEIQPEVQTLLPSEEVSTPTFAELQVLTETPTRPTVQLEVPAPAPALEPIRRAQRAPEVQPVPWPFPQPENVSETPQNASVSPPVPAPAPSNVPPPLTPIARRSVVLPLPEESPPIVPTPLPREPEEKPTVNPILQVIVRPAGSTGATGPGVPVLQPLGKSGALLPQAMPITKVYELIGIDHDQGYDRSSLIGVITDSLLKKTSGSNTRTKIVSIVNDHFRNYPNNTPMGRRRLAGARRLMNRDISSVQLAKGIVSIVDVIDNASVSLNIPGQPINENGVPSGDYVCFTYMTREVVLDKVEVAPVFYDELPMS